MRARPSSPRRRRATTSWRRATRPSSTRRCCWSRSASPAPARARSPASSPPACALQVVSSDETRKSLLGIDPRERHYDAFDHGVYAPSITERTYATMVDRAEALLIAGQSVILDGCFTKRAQRARAIALANRMEVPLLVLDCRCSEELIRERLERRTAKSKGVSDGRWEIYQNQLRTFEPPEEFPPDQTVSLDRSRPVEVLVEELLARVPPQWFDPHGNGSTQ
ncbi:MAG: AAA family ATPase [Thermoanaerobaculaceae bacterium]